MRTRTITVVAIINILSDLRSGANGRIEDAERRLIALAGLSPTACACPDYPIRRSRECWAHPYIMESAAKAFLGPTLKSATVAIRRAIGVEEGGDR